MKNQGYWSILILLLSVGLTAHAQSKPPVSKNQAVGTGNTLIKATREYKANSEELLQFQQEEIKKTTEKLEQLRQLVADGLVARNELAAAEESFTTLKATLEATRKKISDSDQMIAEIQSAELQKTQSESVNKPRSFLRPTVLRYSGAANWSLAHLAGIQSFFSSTFGRPLPTSSVGQSATHNRLGWDHRNAADVPLHPDSAEGKMLITFLQTQGVPYLAFRGAIPGVSTGAHIHIGKPSHRLS